MRSETERGGLPQNMAAALAQTPDGYLWVGTQEGLARFDGLSFDVFNEANTDALPDNSIAALYVARDSTLWIGTIHGSVVRYREGVFSAPGQTIPATREISAFHEDPSGALWIGTFGNGLYRLDGDSLLHLTTAEGLSSDWVSSLHHDREGTLWIGTQEGLNRFRGGDILARGVPAAFDQAYITALFGERGDTLWIGTRDGLGYLALNANPPASGRLMPGTHVLSLTKDNAGSLWVGTEDQGLYRVRGPRVESFSTGQGLSDSKVMALYQDREGSLWIGTQSGGLNRLRASKFINYGLPEGLAAPSVRPIYQSADGSLWFGSEGGGLNRLQEGQITTFTSAQGLANDVVFSLMETAPGTLWIGTLNGLSRWQDGALTTFTTADGLPSNAVFALATDHTGTLWIGTDDGVATYREGTFVPLAERTGQPLQFITYIKQDQQRRLWIGTYDDGLYLLEDDRLRRFTTKDGLGSNIVATIYPDRAGHLWVSTFDGGLSLVESEGSQFTFSTLKARDGLPNDNAFQILEDDAGAFWMGSNAGIYRVARNDLLARLRGQSETLPYRHFDRDDGLRTSEINGGGQPSGWRSRNGHLWFPTIDGVAVIDPAHFPRLNVPPPVVIDAVRVDDTILKPGAVLPPGSGRIVFDFAALTYIGSQNITVRYRLLGQDEEWQAIDPRNGAPRVVDYTNLAPGSYTFEVEAYNIDGIVSAEPARFSFEQAPYFYQTFWFYLLCALVIGGLGLVTYRVRVQQFEHRQKELETIVDARTSDLRQQKEATEEAKAVIEAQANRLEELDRFKTRFFANISHEFRTPLTLMIGPLENALYGAYGAVGTPLRSQMEVMHRNALRLLRLINQLLDLSKLESGKMQLRARPRDVVGFVEGVVYAFTAFAEQKHIRLTFASGLEQSELYFEPDKLEKVFFNLLSNAVKFTPEWGTIAVTIHDDVDQVSIRVRDSGPGIPQDALPLIFDRFRQVDDSNTRAYEGTGIGLALVKELVLLHRGDVQVESEVGQGSTFTVTLPKGRAHLADADLVTDDDELLQPEHGAMSEMASAAFNMLEQADRDAGEGLPVLATHPDADAPLILIVDDNRDIVDYVASCLSGRYRTASAGDGAEGYTETQRLRPDLILCDVMMPNVDGYELTRRIKSDPELRHIPIILLTAKTSQSDINAGIEHGADEFVAKPFNARELLGRIRNLLLLREQERQLLELNEHLEQKVQDQLRTIIREKTRAKEAARLKTEILNNMSHEFRTPLTAILGYADILPMAEEHERGEFIGHIRESGNRLLDTLTAVLDLSTLQSSEVQMNPVLMDTRLLIRRLAQQYAPKAATQNVAFEIDLPETPVTAFVDPRILTRLVEILLENAVKFTEAGRIDVALTASDAMIAIEVRDTGVGISEAFLPFVFEAFKQESEGLSRAHEGTGLGLTIGQHLARLLGGKITVSSEAGKGSSFTIYFPRETAEHAASQIAPPRTERAQRA